MQVIRYTAIFLIAISTMAFSNTKQLNITMLDKKLADLEHKFNTKIGVYAIDTNSNQIISYRGNTLFPVQSTFKVIGVGALLKQSESNNKLLPQIIHYTNKDLVFWHPVTGKYVNQGMSLQDLAAATIAYSDNPAINLIMKQIGGPKAVTAFAQKIGNKSFNLEHDEPNLNSNPKNTDDSATPKDMAYSLEKLTLGNALAKRQRQQLITWMHNSTTGYQRIYAGVPTGWDVADKTGSGSYGIANDIGLVWSPTCKPIVLAIYTVQQQQGATPHSDMVAAATKIILDAYSNIDQCFTATKL